MDSSNKFLIPNSLAEALTMATNHSGDFRYLAGGTDVMVNKYQGNAIENCLIDLGNIHDLKYIEYTGNQLRIGALVRLDHLKEHSVISENYPALIEAAKAVATPVIRKTATLGGNILCENRCSFYNQSEWWREAVGYCLKCDGNVCIATGGTKACFSRYVSDTAPVLIAYDAQLEIMDTDGVKIVDLESIYTGDGMKPLNLSPTAIIRSIILPSHHPYQCSFRKLRPREGVDFTSLTAAVSLTNDGNIKIVLGGLDPMPTIIRGTTQDTREDLISRSLKKARVIDNDIYSRKYRRQMIGVYLKRCFADLGLFRDEEV